MSYNENENTKFNVKNFPKTLGTFFSNYIKVKGYNQEGIQNFIRQREGKGQKSSTLQEFQRLCMDQESKVIFQNYLLEEFMLDLIQSSKVVDPIQYVESISFYFATANEPEKMICNKGQFYEQS